jgi:hypothetical protein
VNALLLGLRLRCRVFRSEPFRHRAEELWPHRWIGPWTLGYADAARSRFSEERHTLVKVEIHSAPVELKVEASIIRFR